MNPIELVVNWMKGVLNIQTKDIAEIKGLNISAEVLSHLDTFIPKWERIYQGEPPWSGKVHQRLNMAKVLCEYLATYNTAELSISVSDGREHSKDCPAQVFTNKLLDDNAFEYRLRALDESKEALGGAAIKPYNLGRRIVLDYVDASHFIPLKADNRRITDAIFVTRTVKGNKLYRLLETHRLSGSEVAIENKLYQSDLHSETLGKQVALTELPEYAALLPLAIFQRDLPLFTYIYPAIANNRSGEKQLGISRFANSIDTLEAIDRAFQELQGERIRARKKIIIPADWMRRRLTDTGAAETVFDQDTDVYQWMNKAALDEKDRPFSFDPSYKIEEYTKDISFHLDTLCLQTGLSPGAISFDAATGIKTATQIRSENSRTFGTVAKNQAVLKQALEDLVHSILYLATHPDFSLLPAGEYEVKVNFDDSVTPDRETYISEGIKLLAAKAISLSTFQQDYLGMTEEEAQKEAEQIATETPAVPDLFGGT